MKSIVRAIGFEQGDWACNAHPTTSWLVLSDSEKQVQLTKWFKDDDVVAYEELDPQTEQITRYRKGWVESPRSNDS